MRKSQIAIFMIIGIVLVISMALIFYAISRTAREKIVADARSGINVESRRGAVKDLIDMCVIENFKKAREVYGFEAALISAHIDMYLDDCIDWGSVRALGIDVDLGSRDIFATVTDASTTIRMTYPITLSLGGNEATLEQFSYSFSRMAKARIAQDADGVVQRDVMLITSDSGAMMVIPAGTRITHGDGTPFMVGEVTMYMLDADIDRPLIFSRTFYDLGPKGAHFSPAIMIKTKHPHDTLVLLGDDFTFRLYDPDTGISIYVPTTVDIEGGELTGYFDTFI